MQQSRLSHLGGALLGRNYSIFTAATVRRRRLRPWPHRSSFLSSFPRYMGTATSTDPTEIIHSGSSVPPSSSSTSGRIPAMIRRYHADSAAPSSFGSTSNKMAPWTTLSYAQPNWRDQEEDEESYEDQRTPRFAERWGRHSPLDQAMYHDVRSFLRSSRSSLAHDDPSSLDLELGDASVWDVDIVAREEEEEEDENDTMTEHEDPDRPNQVSSPSLASHESLHTKKKSPLEFLTAFDPLHPPSGDDPEQLELWLECEAQQEAVARYQKVLDSARQRKDYSSLNLVQRQILKWFQPLTKEITRLQREFMLKEGNTGTTSSNKRPDKSSSEIEEQSDVESRKTVKKYGPFLCTLPPAKLAVIAAHEAIIYSLLKSGSAHGLDGVSFIAMARRIGEAVEEEVVIQRHLHQRYKEAQARSRSRSGLHPGSPHHHDEEANEIASLLLEEPESSNDNDEEATARMKDDLEATRKWAYASSHLKGFLEEISKNQMSAKKRRVIAYALRRAREVLESDGNWSSADQIQLGATLIKAVLENATLTEDGRDEMAFTYEKRWTKKNRLQSFVVMNERMYKMITSDELKSFAAWTTRHKPMIIPPKPWEKPGSGGYLWLKSDLMRYHGCNIQKEALMNADLSTVYDGLNSLGRVPWKINQKVLRVAQRCWNEDIPLGDIPTRTDYEMPDEPVQPTKPTSYLEKDTPQYKAFTEESRRYRESLNKFQRVRRKNMDLRSLRCSAMLKLDQAEKFKDFDQIFFPYNMDFRGRAYPVPPHLSNIGSDLCRGILQFAEAKPLRERGLYWLKVHLANFAGKDKICFDARAAFVDENMEKVRQSAEDPFAGDRWWMKLEDPFQGLATCLEIINAIDSGDPASYMCHLPVHMDGSCNGLQHYAALGRDVVGGKAVNLCATNDGPQDVYIGVMHEVIRRVAEEAERDVDFGIDLNALDRKQKAALINNRAAKLVNGLIDRGVVKRTVMTSVYGVTYIGARQQIQEKIEAKLEGLGYDVDEKGHEVFQACGYLARVTMDVMGDLFTGAKETMNWLTTCARMIVQHGHPVAWISPIGVPVVQPYRQKKAATLVTLMQTVTLVDENDDLPLHKLRQVTAFPPNFVHSLDSSHMLLTALEMDRRGLTFSAVHDSFWTHACDVDEMNSTLRTVFVDLYSQPLLERLRDTWSLRYPDLNFPDVPKRGELSLEEVKFAKYFFQ